MKKLLAIVSTGIILVLTGNFTNLANKPIENKMENQPRVFEQSEFIMNCLIKINEMAKQNEKLLDRKK